jgi:phytoene dehydrogenase-like protein
VHPRRRSRRLGASAPAADTLAQAKGLLAELVDQQWKEESRLRWRIPEAAELMDHAVNIDPSPGPAGWRAGGPVSSWRTDRNLNLLRFSTITLMAALPLWLVYGLTYGLTRGIEAGIAAGLAFGLAFGWPHPRGGSTDSAIAGAAGSPAGAGLRR